MKTPLTQEQKEWYFIGFFEGLAHALAEEINISLDQAREELIKGLEKGRK
jgi:hypothetical protein